VWAISLKSGHRWAPAHATTDKQKFDIQPSRNVLRVAVKWMNCITLFVIGLCFQVVIRSFVAWRGLKREGET